MEANVKRPPAGYDDMRDKDGKPLTPQDQIGIYVDQTIDVINFSKQRGIPVEKIKGKIKQSITELTSEHTERY